MKMAECIERAAAIKSVLRMRRPENSVAQNRMLSIIQMDMLKLPAADVAPVVHGRKIEDGDIGCFWLCSLCGECLPYGANYCPNCGAKMDGGDNNEAD
jgi:hypothetical protein